MTRECVVLLHASLASGRQWRLVEGALSSAYRVFSPDLLQHDSGPAAEADSYSVAAEADAIMRQVDEQVGPRSRFHLVGHAFGAVVALEIARRHAARTISATLYEPILFNRLADPLDREFVGRVARAVELLVDRGLHAGAARMYHDFWYGPGAFDALEEEVREALAGGAAKLRLELRATAPQSSCVRDCSDVTMPVRLLGGSRSFLITRRVLEGLAATLHNATLDWIDADHMGPVNEPDQFVGSLMAFLPGVSRSTL